MVLKGNLEEIIKTDRERVGTTQKPRLTDVDAEKNTSDGRRSDDLTKPTTHVSPPSRTSNEGLEDTLGNRTLTETPSHFQVEGTESNPVETPH